MDCLATGVEKRVCDDIAARQQLGIAKYGTTVEGNPLTLYEWLNHAYQECLDQAVYLKAAMEQIHHVTPNTESNMPTTVTAIEKHELKVPDGWEPVSLEMRPPKPGEYFLHSSGNAVIATIPCSFNFLILRKCAPPWVWPEWLTATYIAMDKSGLWTAYISQPERFEREWASCGPCASLRNRIIAFTPPSCDNWEDSLMKNPNLKD